MSGNIYENATEDSYRLTRLFFRRFKYMRMRNGEGCLICAKNMKAQGSTLSHHTLEKYERPNQREGIRLNTLLIYACYMQKSLMEMIQPLTDEEERDYTELRKKYIQRSECITRGRTKKTA